ncbi:MAG: hypothetical protein RBT75_06735 [Anaerolineae bacterium]|jgi:hypothetical protein|nr:hypothetical protein [Anaerolineae bacterium]
MSDSLQRGGTGWHPVLLRVIDSQGLTAEQAFTITVLYRIRLPLILKATP